ncbi:Phosphoribosylaminoimidazole-succinocarboxamide synthase [Desulfurobacterium thermolithotrophum DSM 11699]|uniref:Phosphoribosylaminoimidazole-succinocarboxamide synthase n=1 Tax=Desulfurobacterium thermolithotrophum (strain DSM 11699 / BSA) TaxID=868864 RepID=F0S142_DESTD|nr:phosphoribosylaminoimidazolesuccinocarboxamide synthase [Desulfurobacterium thermolithotrophum]ADY73920.1 Phosphoribosylaminoimidazole-succinocarboxamide synthase [Desulfurobacterium thermolithotrophum DSM 11699]
MEKKEKLYEGKAKVLYKTDNKDLLVQYFKDDTTAFDGAKKEVLEDKGVINCSISTAIFEYLEKNGIKTHFVERLSSREMLVKGCEIIPVEVVVRNIAAGSFSRRYGVKEGTPLKKPLVEYFYKSDELHDPMVCPNHVYLFEWATKEELEEMTNTALKVNELLKKFFDEIGIILVDFKLEFGRHNGEVILADEITPDSCRLWDKSSMEVLDKDRFRKDMGKVVESYKEIYKRIMERYEGMKE